jgi:hypothetical protein
MEYNPLRIQEIGKDRKEIIAETLDENDILSLLADQTFKFLQTKISLSAETLRLLNDKFFSQRKDVEMRFYYVYENLSFLKNLSQLEHLSIEEKYSGKYIDNINSLESLCDLKSLSLDVHDLKDLSPLSKLRHLRSLSLYFEKPTMISLESIKNLSLESLSLGKVKNLETVSKVVNLKNLALSSISIDQKNISYLLKLEKLEKFFYYGTTKVNLNLLPKIGKIKHLTLKNASIDNFDFIAEMLSLETLNLQYLSKLEKLPSLRLLKNLKKIELWGVKNLKNISALFQAVNLEEFRLNQTKNFQPEDFRIFSQLPKLKIASVYFGAKKRDETNF